MRTYRKTYFRLRANLLITLVATTYHKAWTGTVSLSVPSCSLAVGLFYLHVRILNDTWAIRLSID